MEEYTPTVQVAESEPQQESNFGGTPQAGMPIPPEQPQKKSNRGLLIGILCAVVALALLVAGYFAFRNSNRPQEPEVTEIPGSLAFSCYDDNTKHGNLYYLLPGQDAIKIDSDVVVYQYKLAPLTQVVYYVSADGTLYSCVPGQPREKLADYGIISSLAFSADEQHFVYAAYVSDPNTAKETPEADLYFKSLGGEREKIKTDVLWSLIDISDDAQLIYFCDGKNNFYEWNAETGAEKLSANVVNFYIHENAYYYVTYHAEDNEVKRYVKLSDEENAQRINAELPLSHTFGPGGTLFAYRDDVHHNEDKPTYGELMLYTNTDGELRFASDVVQYEITPDGKSLAYLTADDCLFIRALPETSDKPGTFKKKLDATERHKLNSDAKSFLFSPSGDTIAYTDSNGNLFVINLADESTVRLLTDVKNYYITDSCIYALTGEGTLYHATNYRDENAKEYVAHIADDVTAVKASDYQQYLTYYKREQQTICVLAEDGSVQTVTDDITTYDKFIFNDTTLYSKELTMSDIAGLYYIEEPEQLFSVDAEGKLVSHVNGKPEYATVKIERSIDKFTSDLTVSYTRDGKDIVMYVTYTIAADGKRTAVIDGEKCVVQKLSQENFAKRKAEKEEEERKRVEREKRIAALTELGEKYLHEGYYVSDTATLYATASYDHPTKSHFTTSSVKTVSQYSMDEEGNILWLGMRSRNTDTNSTTTFWVPVTDI